MCDHKTFLPELGLIEIFKGSFKPGITQELEKDSFWLNPDTGFYCLKSAPGCEKSKNCGCLGKNIGKTRGNTSHAKTMSKFSREILTELYHNENEEFFKQATRNFTWK